MKVKGRLISVVVFAVAVASVAYSQNPPQADRVKTIFDYRQELNLSDRQEQDIKAILRDLNREVRVTRAKLTLIEVELADMIKQDAELEQMRKKLREAADIQVALKMADIVGTRKIHKILSPEQLKKWRELQAASARPQK